MELLEHRLKLSSRQGYFNLYGVGDIHLGNYACDEDRLKDDIEKIRKDPYAYWIGMGDYTDCINITDKRFDPKSLAKWLVREDLDNLPLVQADKYIKYFEPIASKCLMLHTGNHEELIRRRYHQDVLAYIALKMKAKQAGYTAFSRMNIVLAPAHTRVLILYSEHGTGGGEYPGAKVNRMIRQVAYKEADLYFYGHTHEKLDVEHAVLTISSRGELRLLQKPVMAMICGSYLRSYPVGAPAYTETRSVRPVALGCRGIRVILERRRVKKTDLEQFNFEKI